MMASCSVKFGARRHDHGDVRDGAFATGKSEDQVRRSAYCRRAGNTSENAAEREVGGAEAAARSDSPERRRGRGGAGGVERKRAGAWWEARPSRSTGVLGTRQRALGRRCRK